MKNLLSLLILLLLTSGCATFQVSTMNHDPIYSIEGSDIEINVVDNGFELDQFLLNNFNYRYDFAQYALSQPMSFDWRFNRFNRFNHHYWYSYAPWDRYQMWNDWVWNYPYSNGIGWSYSWGNNIWSSNSWNSPYGWNNYYGWNNRYRRGNVLYHNDRRNSTVNTNNRTRVVNNKPRVINSKPRINNNINHRRTYKPKPSIIPNNNTPRSTIPTRIVSTRSNNNIPQKGNFKRKN